MTDRKFTRRNFIKALGGASVVGAGAVVAGCASEPAGGKGWMPNQYNVAANWPVQVKGRVPIDSSNPAIDRDDTKCILCGQCLEVCKNVVSVYGYYELPIQNDITCIHCGQCTMWCPTGAITERNEIKKVQAALASADQHVIVQTAPAIRVALGEEFNLPPGSLVQGQQVTALKKAGFDAVFDTSWSADLTIMEEASELIKRLTTGKALPHFTSCCPGWVKFAEYFYADLQPHLSSCKSPQQMLGAVAKSYYAKEKGIAPEQIFSVAVMPCTAKKFECQRPEMNAAGILRGNPAIRDVDVVLTTRELANLLKSNGIDLSRLVDTPYDSVLGESTGAGVIFGATGGVTEAAVRTAYYLVTRQDPPAALLQWENVRGLKGVKEASVELPGVGTVKVAVCHGLRDARVVLEKVRKQQSDWHFIEFMACPGGCIGGGGQPRTSLPPSDEVRKARMANLYKLDGTAVKRASYQNKEVMDLYQKFLHAPLSEESESLLHTHYVDRSHQLKPKEKV